MPRLPALLEITKIQILKVIHNGSSAEAFWAAVVGSHKDTNFESNSQLIIQRSLKVSRCWKSQRYKF